MCREGGVREEIVLVYTFLPPGWSGLRVDASMFGALSINDMIARIISSVKRDFCALSTELRLDGIEHVISTCTCHIYG